MPKHKELEKLLFKERHLTADWYQKMTGNSWQAGEKLRREAVFADIEKRINALIRKDSAELFAHLK